MDKEFEPTGYVVWCRVHGVIADVHSVVEGSTVVEKHQSENEKCKEMSVEPIFTKAQTGMTWD